MENVPSPVTGQINSVISSCKVRYFFFAVVTVFRRPRPDLLTVIVLRVTYMGKIFFDFPRKKRGKKVS